MSRIRRAIARGLGLLCLGSLCSAAVAQVRYIDPNTLPPGEREFALHGPIGDVGPSGRPAKVGCRWSRIQIPADGGLRWYVQEECGNTFDR